MTLARVAERLTRRPRSGACGRCADILGAVAATPRSPLLVAVARPLPPEVTVSGFATCSSSNEPPLTLDFALGHFALFRTFGRARGLSDKMDQPWRHHVADAASGPQAEANRS